MSSNRITMILATAVAFGCSENAVAPIAQSDFPTLQASVGSRVVHRASVGGPDACFSFVAGKPGCDANFSMIALERADSSVTGEWQDQFAQFPGFGGAGIHVAVNCLVVVGNQAWVSGVITASRIPGVVGLGAVTTVVDNGRSANDPADEISLSFIDTGLDCVAASGIPGIPLFAAPQGQVVVQ